jgi:hypothetical protein
MKRVFLVFAVLAACGFVVGACGDDNGGNDCDKAEAKQLEWAKEPCSGKDDACCFCKCANQGKMYDPVKYAADGTCECNDIPECIDNPDTPDIDECNPPCDGARLTGAESCLADEDKCKTDAQKPVLEACDMTPLS